MSNLYNDGIMTNVINASTPFTLHQSRFRLNEPGILIAATDGCFGYLKTPMEFEYLLVDSLVRAKSPLEWKQKLNDRIHEVTGDDYTLSVAGIGYGNFVDMQRSLLARHRVLEEQYINATADANTLWQQYKTEYSLYMK